MDAVLHYTAPRLGYMPGEVIERDVQVIAGALLGRARFTVGASPGGGYAGQVYRAAVQQPGPLPSQVALKVLHPRSRWKNLAREWLFELCFQTAFAPRLREEAVQSGLLWQVFLRSAAEAEFGRPGAVAQPYGYFWDPVLASYVEVHEWVEGRPVRYEPDETLLAGWFRRSRLAPDTEMACKKRFMDALAGLCRRLGAMGLARQYDWYTLVSQSNVLTVDLPDEEVLETASGLDAAGDLLAGGNPSGKTYLVAVDCRPGLAIPFFLPISPAHARIILEGLWRGVLVHYDEVDFSRLMAYLGAHPDLEGLRPLVDRLAQVDATYRAGLPDLWHTRTRLLRDAAFRGVVCRAAAQDWERSGLVPPGAAAGLAHHPRALMGLWLLACLPLIGHWLVRLLAHLGYRRHLHALLARPVYRRAALACWRERDLPAWLADERIPPARARRLETSLASYAAEKLLLAPWPAGLHRLLVDPSARRALLQRRLLQPLSLLVSQPARLRWLEGILAEQRERGVIPPDKAHALLGQLNEPRMQGFIRDLGLATGLDIFSRLVYLVLGLYGLSTGDFLPLGLAALSPISPSGVLRFFYVLARLVIELPANLLRRDPGHSPWRLILARLVALLASPWRWFGNLFPLLEISAVYTRLAFVLAEYYAVRIADSVPIYGGPGKLLEYWVFQVSFNLPLSLHHELKRRRERVSKPPPVA